MNTLAAMVTGIIIGRETQLPQIATHVPESIKLPSTEKRLKRLMINKNITEETYFLPFIQSLLNNLGLEEMVISMYLTGFTLLNPHCSDGARHLILLLFFNKMVSLE